MCISDTIVASGLIDYLRSFDEVTSSVGQLIVTYICVLAVFFRFFSNLSFEWQLTMESVVLAMEILGYLHLNSEPTSELLESQVGRISKAKYGSIKAEESGICGICWESIEDDEEVLLLGSCNHYYHISCIDCWLHRSNCCPMCRRDVTHHNSIKSFALQLNASLSTWLNASLSTGLRRR